MARHRFPVVICAVVLVGALVSASSVAAAPHRAQSVAPDPCNAPPGVAPAACGGGAKGGPTPEQLTPAQRAVVARKLAAQQAFLAHQAGGTGPGAKRSSVGRDYKSGDWYYADNYTLKPEPNVSDCFGNCPQAYGGAWYCNATMTNLSRNINMPWPRARVMGGTPRSTTTCADPGPRPSRPIRGRRAP